MIHAGGNIKIDFLSFLYLRKSTTLVNLQCSFTNAGQLPRTHMLVNDMNNTMVGSFNHYRQEFPPQSCLLCY